MEFAGIGIYRYKFDGTVLFMDQSTLRILELEDQFPDSSSVVGKNIADLIIHIQPEEILRSAVRKHGQVHNFEYPFLTLRGEKKWTLHDSYVVRDPNTGEDVVQVVVRDITELKRVEEALRKSEERYRELFENANDIVYTHDLAGRFTSFNNAGQRITGYEREELLQLNVFQIVVEEDHALVQEMIDKKLAGEETTQYEVAILTKDCRRVPLEVSTRLLYKGGEPVEIQGIARDITERKRAESERQQLESQIRQAQKLESLGVLAGGLAHDFNNLLAGILGNAGLARMRLPEDSPASGYLEKIETAARRAAELVNQILAYAGKGTFPRRPLDLSELVRGMAQLLEASISKKITLHLELDSGLPFLEGDPGQLQQVVMNLLTNASEAIGDERGVITLRTFPLEADEAYLADMYLRNNLSCDRYVSLEVIDTGCGMDEGTRARLFDPFFTTKFAGRGLGLATVLGIVRSHGGGIKVQSEINRGSTFTILFPALATREETPENIEQPRESSQPPGQLPQGAILIADDVAEIREVIRETCEACGYHVLTARDGREAVEMFRAHADRIAVVLLDLTMPVLSGDEVLDEIHRIRPDVPILLSSGFPEEEARRRFPKGGPAGFIQKPYLPDELMRMLAEIARSPHETP